MSVDPTAPSTGQKLQHLIRSGELRPPKVPMPEGRVTAELVGAGESYAAWLVNDQVDMELLWRVPRREPAEMPRPMRQEFAALREVPDGWGTRGLAMDDSTANPLGMRYMVTTFVPGRVRSPAAWTPDDLLLHAERLAGLHRPEYSLSGPVGEPGSGPVDLLDEFDKGFEWWSTEHTQVVDDPRLANLAQHVRAFIEQRAPAFDGYRSYSFVHGDLVATNVVAGPDRVPRYIDWEWAQIGDIAQDLAYIGGTVHGGPWYVPMTNKLVGRFMAAYVNEVRRLGRSESLDPDALAQRRDAWEVYERFLSCHHFVRQERTYGVNSIYPAAVNSLSGTLRDRLGQRL